MFKLFTCICCFFNILSFAQTEAEIRNPDGGGEYKFAQHDEMSAAERASIINFLKENKVKLQKAGKWLPVQAAAPSFIWPIRAAASLTDNGFYAISNYVDHNSAFPNKLQDYNCGTRTYDLSSGYNHQGTDIFTWPFPWYKMANNQVEIIAADGGTIIAKADGNYDKNCELCTTACYWNAVYIRHADGSVAWYGHMKTGSLTNKAIGETVAQGEYLGVVGSSGSSTGPHLHFEVYANDSYTQLIDPWQGSCNPTLTNSYWAAQQPYRVTTLAAIKTHGKAPVQTQCYAGEMTNFSTVFYPGDTVYLGSYYRDQQAGLSASHQVLTPSGGNYISWIQNSAGTYTASWWYYYVLISNTPAMGNYTYKITYNGIVHSTQFTVMARPAQPIYIFNGNGYYSNPSNWQGGAVPPNPVPTGVDVKIATTGANTCIIDQVIQFNNGSTLTLESSSKVVLPQNLIVK